ncbi:MAG: VOC family protein [Puniceicoccales bacterium]
METCLYVDDLHAAEHFYGTVLRLKLHSREEGKFVFFHLGEGMLLIFDPDASRGGAHDLPDHGAEGVQHVAFAVSEDSLDDWRQHLEQCGVAIEQDYYWPHGPRSLYFRDPAGHSIELAPRALWQ